MASDGPRTLTVVMLGTERTRMAIIHENEWMPYSRRTVHIKLTDEQREQLAPRKVGFSSGRDVYEEIGDVFLEADDAE